MTDGFLNLMKPPGMSSHDMVDEARRVLQIRRIGHAGTLDPGAAGVLPLAVGRAARFISYLSGVGKSYRAELQLGFSTDSGDLTGTVTEHVDHFEMPLEHKIKEAMIWLTGSIEQVPSVYSAIKVNGKRACDLVRSSKNVKIPPRKVEIRRFELLGVNPLEKKLLLDIDCSKGTYIRTLCEDLGKRLGIPATMSFLVRTRAGDFHLEDSLSIEEFKACGSSALHSPEGFLGQYPPYALADNRIRAYFNGLSTQDRKYDASVVSKDEPFLRVYAKGVFIGLGRWRFEDSSVLPEKPYLTQEAGLAL